MRGLKFNFVNPFWNKETRKIKLEERLKKEDSLIENKIEKNNMRMDDLDTLILISNGLSQHEKSIQKLKEDIYKNQKYLVYIENRIDELKLQLGDKEIKRRIANIENKVETILKRKS